MGKGHILGEMVEGMKENTSLIRNTDLEYILGQMGEVNIKY